MMFTNIIFLTLDKITPAIQFMYLLMMTEQVQVQYTVGQERGMKPMVMLVLGIKLELVLLKLEMI